MQARLLAPEQARDATIREERERARLIRQRMGRPQRGGLAHETGTGKRGALETAIHPAEVLAAMELPLAGNPTSKLTEKLVMEVVAHAANLPFVDLDPLKIDAKLAPQ